MVYGMVLVHGMVRDMILGIQWYYEMWWQSTTLSVNVQSRGEVGQAVAGWDRVERAKYFVNFIIHFH